MLTTAHSDGFVTVGGLRLHYEQWGRGERTVICLHGTSLHGRVWEWLVERLPPSLRVIGLDQRAHGSSDRARPGEYTVDYYYRDLLGVADALGIERMSLVGSSLGSRVALKFAAEHPERVEAMILLDLSFEMPKAASDEMIHAHITRPRRFATMEEAVAFSKTLPQRLRFTDEVHRRTLAGDLKTNPDGTLEWRYDRNAAIETLSVAARDMWEEVRCVQAPVLILRGELSNVLLPETAERMTREFKNARVVTIPGSGHSIWGDNPDATAEAIRGFLLASH